jgi:hypothetical protein
MINISINKSLMANSESKKNSDQKLSMLITLNTDKIWQISYTKFYKNSDKKIRLVVINCIENYSKRSFDILIF